MAKRSDFAQKLLDDLRVRKERMATSSQSQRSTQSNQLPIDAYAYSKQAHRGSRGMKPNDIINSRNGDILNRSSRSHRTGNIAEVTNQIVPYGRNQSSVQMNDMSMALAFAFENGAKLRRTDSSFTSSILGFLHQFKRGNVEFGKMERQGNMDRQLVSTSHFPILSPMQIKEISRGAQKLNQILRACSDGYNVDRYSLEFAKELLQGAMDLEESLRVLVDMQKASEMITPQKKNRIKLLDEDDDEEEDDYDNMSKAKQLARPVFSFDKPSRQSQNLQETGNDRLMQRPIAVSYYKEGRNSRNEKKDVNAAKLSSHKRSASYSSEIKNPSGLSGQKSQSTSSQSNKEKARIPNVVAKLMGLASLPEKVELKNTPQKDSGSRQTKEGMTIKKIELKNRQTENLVPQKKQKVVEAISMPTNQHKELMLGADKNFIIQKANSEAAVVNGKPVWKDLDGIKAFKSLEKANIKIDMKHEHIGKGRTKDPLLNNMMTQLEQAHEKSEVRSSLQEGTESNGSVLQSGKRATNKQTTSNTKTSQNHLRIQKSNTLLKNGHQEEKPQRERRVQQSTKQKTSSKSMHEMINSQKKKLLVNQASSLKHKSGDNVDTIRSEGFTSSHCDDLIRDEGSNDLNVKVKEISNRKSGQISALKDGECRAVKGRYVMMMDEKSVHKLANKNVKSTRMQKTDMSGKIDEVSSGGRNRTMLHKHQSSVLPEERQRRPDEFNVAKEEHQRERIDTSKESGHIISANNSVVIAESLDARQQPHKEARLPPRLYCPDGEELQSLKEQVALVPSDSYHDVKSVMVDDMQDEVTLVAAEEFKSFQNSLSTMTGTEVRMDISNNSQLVEQKMSERRIQEPLTESENCLKWILVMSQLFLNTAEALFRLDIPLNILQAGIQENHDEEGSKLILDCGYEVMKRKGIRQELKVHPCSKTSISTIKIRSLDELVRQLNRDMEKIKFYGRNISSKADIEDYLPKMLENDVYGKDPDIDCMWDLGWNDDTFAFVEKYDVIRDMEKHILNGLLDEVTRELLHLQGINMTRQR